MRLHRFYIDQEIGSQKDLTINSADLVHQVRRVFRLKSGDSIVVFNGTGFDYVCKIDFPNGSPTIDSDSHPSGQRPRGPDGIDLVVTSVSKSRFTSKRTIYLCAAVVKKDTFEWIVQKATELGISSIIPIAAEHSEKKSLNDSRLKKIAIEAAEQSGRGDVPVIHPIMRLDEAVSFLRKQGARQLVFHTEGERFQAGSLAKPHDENETLGVFIGPEGGWSETELDVFHKNDVPVVYLGPQVLRAETAVVAALSQVVFG